MLTKRDIQISKLLGPKAVTEASLGRVYQHFMKSGEKSWAIISAFKYGLTPEENNNKDKRLKAWLSQKGFGTESERRGYFRVVGHWTELDPATGEPALDQGKVKQAHELAYFVMGVSQDQAIEAMKEFDQQAVLYSGPETEGKVSLIHASGDTQVFDKFAPQTVGNAFSTVRGKGFRFESLELSVLPTGHVEAMSFFDTKKLVDEGSIEDSTLQDLDLRLKLLWR